VPKRPNLEVLVMRYLRPTGRIALSRPSPAMAVGLLALFVALGGSALAVTRINGSSIQNGTITGNKLKKHTITASLVANNTLRGRQIDESTLGVVPRAATTNALNTVPVQTVRPGDSVALFKDGPFTITGSCERVPNGPNPINQRQQIARVTLTSSEDRTAVSAGTKDAGGFNAQLPRNTPFQLSSVTASAGTTEPLTARAVSYGAENVFEAFTPGPAAAAISGQIQPMSQFGPLPGSETNLCQFHGFVVTSLARFFRQSPHSEGGSGQ
jgi:hypothetical protein